MSADELSPIGYVSRATGLSTHVLRAWERRYGAVKPNRASNGRRLYSRGDIDRLALLKLAVEAGHTISQLAGLDTRVLERVVARSGSRSDVPGTSPGAASREALSAGTHLDHCLSHLYRLDGGGLQKALDAACIDLHRTVLLTEVVSPLLSRVGDLWASGSIKIIHEHTVSVVVQAFLWEMLRSAPKDSYNPGLVVTTPLGQWCYLGAMMAAVVAADSGWQVHYFGPSLPAEEITAAVKQKRAAAVALSITYRADDRFMENEIRKLKRLLGDRAELFVGGRAAAYYREIITECGGNHLENLKAFVPSLNELQIPANRPR